MSVTSSVFKPVLGADKVEYPKLEQSIQQWWDQHNIRQQYIKRNENSEKRYSFLDGPITANNPMGVHHAWGRTYKDIYQRFKTMQGYKQRYQNGFDCQGLWVEVEVEKELGLKTKRDIEEFGIARFVERCKERVFRFAKVQMEQSIRLGYWMDWGNDYYTLSDENNYTIWYFLKKCKERGLIYKGRDVMPWCPRCATGISNMEMESEGYKETTHLSLYVRFPLVDRPGEYLLAWTTTPWTLTSNVAAAVHPDLPYVRVEQDGEFYYLAEELLPVLKMLKGRDKGEYRVTETLKGSDMVGWKYRGPFDELPAAQGVEHRVIPWKDVSATEGTGIVHIAPGCGREDFGLGKEFNLAVIAPVDESGVYVDGFDWLTGQKASEVAQQIAENLTQKGMLYRPQNYRHRYPTCWRCKTELIFRLVDEWFISMDQLRYEIMEVVKKITWLPSWGFDREMDWLQNMDDWMISKKRYWGLALPIFDCPKCGTFEVIGSKEELKERAVSGWEEFDGHSPHRPWIDAVKIKCQNCGTEVSRIKDVGNPWLDAGIVPFSTLGYRTNPEYWKQWFPANFVTESFPGQFRNWFYSMLVMSTVLEQTNPFETLFGYALVYGEDGTPMHKSKGNLVIFDDAAERVGSDAMRWLYTNHVPEQNLNFPNIPTREDMEKAEQMGVPVRLSEKWMQVRKTIDKIWNVYWFFVTYANIDQFDPTAYQLAPEKRSELDRWILSELQEVIRTVTHGLEHYDTIKPGAAIQEFVDDLSNWYLRRSRERIWKSTLDDDKLSAYLTLYECLTTLVTLLAPFMPFVTEELYQNLVRSVNKAAPLSVHLCDWPVAREELVDEQLEKETHLVMRVVGLGRAAREKAQIRVRQPLHALHVRVTSPEEEEAILRLKEQVLEELNIKELKLMSGDSDMLAYTLKPQAKVLGPRYGALVQKIIVHFKNLDTLDTQKAAQQLNASGELTITVSDQSVTLTPEEVQVISTARPGYVTAEERGYIVALETTITPELREEGIVRDLTHFIQDMRKKAGLNIEDHIGLALYTDAELANMLIHYGEEIQSETLARNLLISVSQKDKPSFEELYRETIAPNELKKLDHYTVEVVIGKLS
ncbi:isoleucyl-tRNA synthetase [Thermosporothrix hazakensis]|uniref:Isoleucine--tRNA ligase n=2 Tax=Thermosporothrix TaxID=768650 RepID=A0A326UAT5_THEHA|nr:isoleucine--tRNA ligase [Thermosporothrix hazakensis]PZW32050.1 isoleucyl-tRNA synthetase [Thermosporothrix hazakensis]BBH91477.1 isoleucine--tRNA ligase [Thermosporothrix sp. COM3]GCE49622.1 isoleucine--tRNA ligase [Thermosporothrix hazakensis]